MKTILRFQLLLFLALTNADELFAQWQSIGPFGTGYNTILKFDPWSPGRLFASGDGTLFRSDDGGKAWRSVTPPTGPMNGECGLAISASVPGAVFAVSEMSIYRSTDYGDSWTLNYSDSTRRIAFVDELNPNHLLAYVSHGSGRSEPYVQTITQSTDGGEHWRTTVEGIDTTMGPTRVWVNKNFPHIMFAIQMISFGGDVIDGTNVFKTFNTGATWEKLDLDTHQYYSYVIFDPRDSNIVYLSWKSNQWLKSTNAGDSWTAIGSGLPNGGSRNLFTSPASSGVLYTSIALDTLEQCDIYISETGGNSWRLWGSVTPSQNISYLAVDIHRPEYLYAASYPYGVLRTSDEGKTWTNISQGLSQSNVSSCLPVSEKVMYAGVGNIGLEKTTDGGLAWKILVKDRSSEAGKVVASRVNHELIYTNVFMNGGGLSISTNGGISWQTYTCQTCLFSEFDIGPDDLTIYGNTSQPGNNGLSIGGLVKSSDGGQSWTTVDLGISGVNFIARIAVDPSDHETVYALIWIRGSSNRDVLIKSTDGGNHWRELADGVANFFLHPRSSHYLYYSNESFGDPSSFISGDGGETFQKIIGALQIKSLSADPKRNQIVYALTYDGAVVVSTDNGYTWELSPQVDRRAGLKNIHTTCAKDSITILLGETTTEGILSDNIDGLSPLSVPTLSGAQEFTLAQNYPNPFNPSTVISYHVPRIVFVTLKVYDVLGREVKTLIHGQQNAGSHSIAFDASTLASGIYFYRLLAGTFTETKTLIVLR